MKISYISFSSGGSFAGAPTITKGVPVSIHGLHLVIRGNTRNYQLKIS